MEQWKELVRNTISTPEKLSEIHRVDYHTIKKIHQKYPLRITPYYLSLIQEPDDPIWKQVIPDRLELEDAGFEDPLGEEENPPAKHLVHRYPDRVLFYVTSFCATYCRFCTRKRKVGDSKPVLEHELEPGLEYIRNHSEVRDVIVSGGDPLMLSDERIEYILKELRKIPHVEIIRIGTRIPVTLPQRITADLCALFKKYHPLYINTHFNHPREITPESTRACAMLADAGIPLGNQSVLLKGVNDDPDVMKELVQKLLSIRVRPYYIYQMDPVKGASHFRTSVERGLEIIKALRGYTSGLAVPHYVIDTAGGKVALIPNPLVSMNDMEIVLKTYRGEMVTYSNPGCQLASVD